MYEYRAKVTRVVDGDTLDVDVDLGFDVWLKNRVRMYGIDTPESRTRDKEEKYRGLLSKEALKEHLKVSKEVILKTKKGEETGKFGRILAEVWIDGVNINKQLIKDGYAVAYHGQSKESVEKKHDSNRKKLIEAGIYKYKG
jgi:micrococcal nuclease